MSEKCSRCKENLEEWFEPCFGKYRGKALCRKCDEELQYHKVYKLRLKLSVYRMELKTPWISSLRLGKVFQED